MPSHVKLYWVREKNQPSTICSCKNIPAVKQDLDKTD